VQYFSTHFRFIFSQEEFPIPSVPDFYFEAGTLLQS
jgi:hypothetical protein